MDSVNIFQIEQNDFPGFIAANSDEFDPTNLKYLEVVFLPRIYQIPTQYYHLPHDKWIKYEEKNLAICDKLHRNIINGIKKALKS